MAKLQHPSEPLPTQPTSLLVQGLLIGLVLLLGLVGAFVPALAVLLVGGLGLVAALVYFRRLSRGVAALIVAATLNGLTLPLALGGVNIQVRPDQLALVLVLFLFALGYVSGRVHLYRTELDIPILGLVGANLLASALYSPMKGMSLQGVVLMVTYALMYFVTVNILIQLPRPRLAQITRFYVWLGVIHAGVGLLAFLAYAVGLRTRLIQLGQTVGSVSLAGVFAEANLLAIYLAIIGAFLLTYLVQGGLSGPWRLRLFGGLGAVVVAMGLTLTRSAWLVFAALVPVILFPTLRLRGESVRVPRRVLMTLGVLLVVLLLVLVVFGPLISQLSSQSNLLWLRIQRMLTFSDSSIVGRSTIYQIGLQRWRENPLWGNGTFSGEVVGVRWLYSSIVQTLHDSGVVGLVFFVWLVVRTIWTPWREARRAPSLFYRSSLFAAALGNVVIFLTSQTSSIYWIGLPWVFMGLTIALVHASRQARRLNSMEVS